MTVYVRFWHKADMLNALTNVRFWGQSGHGPTAAYQTRFMSTRPSSTLQTRAKFPRLISEHQQAAIRTKRPNAGSLITIALFLALAGLK